MRAAARSKSENPVRPRDFKLKVSRPAAVAFWTAGIAVVHVGIPIVLARSTPRAAIQAPPAVRLVGLTSLAGGLAGLIWALAQHFEAVPEGGGYTMALTPDYLLQSGPYRFSRNPMYVAEAAMWAGWTLLLGSPTVAGATALLALGLSRAVTLEEEALAARFGKTWQAYAARTPRWLGLKPPGKAGHQN
jgi:protein-S-isoprenylcysteine O-methyltransferase Ste14